MRQVLDTPCPFGIYCHCHLRVFLLDLIWFITNHLHRCLRCSQYISATLALITPAQHGHIELVLQKSDEIFHMGGFACAANSDVTHGDDGYAVRLALQNTHIEEHIPEPHAQAVQPTQWQQFLIDSDEIPLHGMN